jgi:hypothetical protein
MFRVLIDGIKQAACLFEARVVIVNLVDLTKRATFPKMTTITQRAQFEDARSLATFVLLIVSMMAYR